MPADPLHAGSTLNLVATHSASRPTMGAAAVLCWLVFTVALLCSQPVRAWEATQMAQAAHRKGPAAVAALGPLQALLRAAARQTDAQRVYAVNAFYNQRITFATDREVWGQEDYWASPLQMLAKGRGDCEDYAIAKYATLLAAGVTPESLRLVYVRAMLPHQTAPEPHMVLTWQNGDDADPLVLDNLRAEPMPASQRADLTPLFSFNAEGLWQDSRPAGNPMVRLSRWREVWQRTREEGFP